MDGQQQEDLKTATEQFAILDGLHQSFANALQPSTGATAALTATAPAATSTVTDSDLAVQCLGVPVDVSRRPVFHPANGCLLEYEFSAQYGGDRVPLWRLYLESGGGLYTDSSKTNFFCDCNDGSLAENIQGAIGSQLLQSKLFKPKPGL